jgi:hypothetical protein
MKRVSGEMKVGILPKKTKKIRTKRQSGRTRKLKRQAITVYMFEKMLLFK